MVDEVHEHCSAVACGPVEHLCWNLSYDGENYHAKYYYPRLIQAAISARSATLQQSTDHQAQIPGTASSKLGMSRGIARSKKMSTSNAEPGPGEVAEDLAMSSALSDTDTAFSEDSALAELTEVGDGRYADFPGSPPYNSDADSTYNSDRSSVSTLEGEDTPHFHLGSEGEGEGEGTEEETGQENEGMAIPGRRNRKKPGISLIVGSAPLLSDMSLDKLSLSDGPSKEKDSTSDCAEGNFYEDREFDFLKAEPVRRSTSLKTYKTPPGTPRRKKAVRFADVLGLDLESVRHILNQQEPPTVPPSAMKDLKVGLEREHRSEGIRYLTAVFSQPGARP